MDTLEQTDRLIFKKKFELTEVGLRGYQKTFFSSREYFVDYEDIGVRVLISQTGVGVWLVGAVLFFILALGLLVQRETVGQVGNYAEVFWLAAGTICGLVFWLTYKKTFYLVQQGNKNAIEFIYNKASKSELNEFINALKSKRKQVLDGKYGQFNVLLPYEQNHQNLMWLLNNDVINKIEFDERLNQLNSQFNKPAERKIGFKTAD